MEPRRRILVLLVVLPLLLAGCGESKAQEEAGAKSFYEQEQHEKHTEEVKKEAGEVEAVIQHRAAEETANQLEQAAK